MWIDRPHVQERLLQALSEAPAVLLTGPRQVGKSSLVRRMIDVEPQQFYDLEDPRDLARLAEPTLALSGVSGPIVIDEAQLRPDLFPILRVLIDEDRRPGRFVILGSASPDLIGLSSETLAGRVSFVELGGFTLADVGLDALDSLWFRGGLPNAFLATDDAIATRWLDDYITTFLNRDLALLGLGPTKAMPATTLRRFWSMLAHYHGQTWNAAEIARSIDVSQPTVRKYVDALTDALVVRQLQPWHVNLSKRQVRSPRVYIRDTGLLHRLLDISTRLQRDRNPKLGASWEGLIIEHLATRPDVNHPTFWSTHTGAEVDLRLDLGDRVVGVEIKRTDAPRTTKSMHSAIADLSLDHLYVVHSGAHQFALSEAITAVPAVKVLSSASAVGAFSG